jgi:hypothetical protein
MDFFLKILLIFLFLNPCYYVRWYRDAQHHAYHFIFNLSKCPNLWFWGYKEKESTMTTLVESFVQSHIKMIMGHAQPKIMKEFACG